MSFDPPPPLARRTLLLGASALLLPLCALGASGVSGDLFAAMRQRWRDVLTGGAALDADDADIARAIVGVTNRAQSSWDTMTLAPQGAGLWRDAPNILISPTMSYRRLEAMAVAYATERSALYRNPALATAILSGLAFMHAKSYARNHAQTGNWWDWEIGTPQSLNNTLVLMHDELGPDLIERYVDAIDYYVPDPAVRQTRAHDRETGANLLDKCLVAVLRGVVGGSPQKVAQGQAAAAPVFAYVESGDGFYRDGSFIQHSTIPYAGGYGLVLLSSLGALLYVLHDSPWQLREDELAPVTEWLRSAYLPFLYRGVMMDAVRGRGVSRPALQDRSAGRMALADLAMLAEGLPAAAAGEAQAMARGLWQTDSAPPAEGQRGEAYSPFRLAQIKRVVTRADRPPQTVPQGVYLYPHMGRALLRGDGFAFAISLFSKAITAFEYGNTENLHGWWTGAGMTYLYNASPNTYGDGFWPTVDWRRLAGTTSDGSGAGIPASWGGRYFNPNPWVGGSMAAGVYAAVGFDFSMRAVTQSSLQGRKSWFLLRDKVVAMGTGISGGDGAAVETLVENRKLDLAGRPALSVDGQRLALNAGRSQPLPAPRWAHLAAPVPGGDIGYYFPSPQPMTALYEVREGTWGDINGGLSAAQAKLAVGNQFLSLSIGHGKNPDAASYAYAILPNRTAAEMAAFAAQPSFTVLEQSEQAHAVLEHDGSRTVVAANFWRDSTHTVSSQGHDYLSSSRCASVTIVETAEALEIGLADPTGSHDGAIALRLERSAIEVLASHPAITVQQLSPQILLLFQVTDSAGVTRSIRLRRQQA